MINKICIDSNFKRFSVIIDALTDVWVEEVNTTLVETFSIDVWTDMVILDTLSDVSVDVIIEVVSSDIGVEVLTDVNVNVLLAVATAL